MNKILNMYTDGACSGNQNDVNVGGYGAILEYGDVQKEIFGGEPNTTNNRMELMAVISAFRALKKTNLRIRVFTDSSYVANCFREKWYENWRKNGWKNSQKNPVENRDLWEELLSLTEQNQVSFFRVKGHVDIDRMQAAEEAMDDPAARPLSKLYEKFCSWNGMGFTYGDFEKITRMNNRADELANKGMDELK